MRCAMRSMVLACVVYDCASLRSNPTLFYVVGLSENASIIQNFFFYFDIQEHVVETLSHNYFQTKGKI